MTALLALGAAQFNLGDAASAEKQWLAVLAIDPKNVEAYYDLGFMYLSQNPPDMANVKLQWGKVIEIDPNSDVAKTVATHLDSLDRRRPRAPRALPASAAPSASPATPARPPRRPRAGTDAMTTGGGVGDPDRLPGRDRLVRVALLPAPRARPTSATWSAPTPRAATARRRAAFYQSLAFVAGFSVVFITLWASVGLVGYVLRDYVGLLRQLGGAVLVFMGLHVAGVINVSALYREVRLPVGADGRRHDGASARPLRPPQLPPLRAPRRRLRRRLDALHRADPRRDHRPRLGQRQRRRGHRPARRLRGRPGRSRSSSSPSAPPRSATGSAGSATTTRPFRS